ncbi:DNA N-6-adenine-methyltransferase [Escherichia coli]|uniref:DNA N-6-adenine-methyltransferase n=1 Tax=Escherichia coli TaxID=562 RepID=UPI003986CC63
MIGLDVACNRNNTRLPNFIGVERDALKCSWGEPGTVVFLNPPYSKITTSIDAAIRRKAQQAPAVNLYQRSSVKLCRERSAAHANETVNQVSSQTTSGNTGADLGLVGTGIDPGGSMLLIFRGYCQEAGHTISKIPLAVITNGGRLHPAGDHQQKRPRKKAASSPISTSTFEPASVYINN